MQNKNMVFRAIIILCCAFFVIAVLSCDRGVADDADNFIAEDPIIDAVKERPETEPAEVILQEEKPSSQDNKEQSLEDVKEEFETIRQDETDLIKIFDFIDENIHLSDEEFADEMIDHILLYSISELLPFSERYFEQGIQEKIRQYHDGSTDLHELADSPDGVLSELAKDTLKRRYKLIGVEGPIEPIVDYKAYQEYSRYLSDPMNAFIDIMSVESDKPSLGDGSIVISLEEYVERIMSFYAFEEKYSGFPRIYYVVNGLNIYLWIYMGGIDNTPVFDHNQDIIQERLDDFKMNLIKYEDSRFAEKLNEYLELLSYEGYKRTPKIEEYIENLTFY